MAAKKQLRKTTGGSQTSKVNPDGSDAEDEVDVEEQDDNISTDEVLDEAQPEEAPESHEDPVLANLKGTDEGDTAPVYERLIGAPRDGRSFQPGEPVVLKGIQKGGLLTVQEPVYRAVKAPGSSRWRYHLLMSRGSQIAMSKVKEIGAREDAKSVGTFQTDQNNLH